jgi:glycosyltransferase involved in cell wall biosynthesis
MLFSIVIPTLNEENFIGGILSDLVQQDLRDFEIVHVDGRSEDKTCEIVQSYRNRLTLRTITSTRRNLSYQRNVGADDAKGRYLIFIDADIRIPRKSFLTQIAKEVQKTQSLIYLPKVEVNKKDIMTNVMWELYNASVELSKQSKAPIPTSGMFIVDKQFFMRVGKYHITQKHDNNILFAEDQDVLRRAKKMGVVGKTLSHISYHMSLRRFEREGLFKTGTKMMLSVVEQMLERPLTQHHEMGGHLYKDAVNTRK